MYGKTVEIELMGGEITLRVFVFCVPETPESALRERALAMVFRAVEREMAVSGIQV